VVLQQTTQQLLLLLLKGESQQALAKHLRCIMFFAWGSGILLADHTLYH
jgi:hypothetical protein